MFMRFWGGGVGHLGTHHLDSRLKGDNHKSDDGQQKEARVGGMYENGNHLSEEQNDGMERDEEGGEGGEGERTSSREANDNKGDEEDEDEDEDGDGDCRESSLSVSIWRARTALKKYGW